MKSTKLIDKIKYEKDQLQNKIKKFLREVNDKVLVTNQYKKNYKNTGQVVKIKLQF